MHMTGCTHNDHHGGHCVLLHLMYVLNVTNDEHTWCTPTIPLPELGIKDISISKSIVKLEVNKSTQLNNFPTIENKRQFINSTMMTKTAIFTLLAILELVTGTNQGICIHLTNIPNYRYQTD